MESCAFSYLQVPLGTCASTLFSSISSEKQNVLYTSHRKIQIYTILLYLLIKPKNYPMIRQQECVISYFLEEHVLLAFIQSLPMKLLLFVCWSGECLRSWDMILWMFAWVILCPALHSVNFKTWKYPHDMHCNVPHEWCLLLYTRQEKRAEKSTWRSWQGHILPSLQKSPFAILPWLTHDINGVIKANSPSLNTGDQKLVVGGEGGKEFSRSSHFP